MLDQKTKINFLHQRCNPNLKRGISEQRCAYFCCDDGTYPTERHHTSSYCRQTPETSRRSMNTNQPDRQHKIYTAVYHPRRRQEDLTHLSLGSSGRWLYASATHRPTRFLAGNSDCRLLTAIADLVNLVCAGKLDLGINTILYGGHLIALSKTNGGERRSASSGCWRRSKKTSCHLCEFTCNLSSK